MTLRINTAYKYHLIVILLIGTLSTPTHAKECDLPDARQEAICLRQLVGEMKQDMRTLISDIERDKARTEEFVQQGKQVEAQFRTVISQKDTIISKQDEIIGLHEQDTELAAKQIDLYKTCCLGSAKGRLRLHVGLGATGSDTEVAGMVGVGLENFNVFGFFQKDNAGLMLGYQF